MIRTIVLDDLIQRQVQQIIALFHVNQDLAGIAQDRFHGFKIHALPRYIRRLLIGLQDLGETTDITFRSCDYLGLISIGIFGNTRCATACLGNNLIGVGFGFIDQAVLIFTGTNGVEEGFLYLFGWLGVLKIYTSYKKAVVITVKNGLQ